MTYSKKPEETLDPENWDEFRALGHKMLDDVITHIINSKTQPARLATKEEISELTVPLSKEGEGEEKAYKSFIKNTLPSSVGAKNARVWSHILGGGARAGWIYRGTLLTQSTHRLSTTSRRCLNILSTPVDYF